MLVPMFWLRLLALIGMRYVDLFVSLGKSELAGDDVGPEISDLFALVWSISYCCSVTASLTMDAVHWQFVRVVHPMIADTMMPIETL